MAFHRYYFENIALCGNCNGTGLQGYMDYCRLCQGTGLHPISDHLMGYRKDTATKQIAAAVEFNAAVKVLNNKINNYGEGF